MIRVLSKNVSDKIAAGEVIERPVSIVKELAENSIDAGATSVTVEIRNGGKTYIRVTDNGCGIDPDECSTAFLRHATSKIEKASDLDRIESLGFRGEALASIAAVTRTTMISKIADSPVGRRVVVHGGTVIENVPVGAPEGTTIIVTDLFYNTPARREFLKNDGAESSRIIALLSELAVAYPNVKMTLINNGETVFTSPGDGNIKNAIVSVYRQKEYKELTELAYREGDISIRGCISRPSLTRTSRRDQICFVNGRVVDSPVMLRGIKDGYKQRMFEGRYPVAFIMLETEPGTLDVNIHPAKREVRFHDDKAVTDFISRAIRLTLAEKESVSHIGDTITSVSAEETTEAIAPTPSFKRIQDSGSVSYFNKKPENQVDIKQLLKTKREEETKLEEIKQIVREEKAKYQASKDDFDMKPGQLMSFDFSELKILGSLFNTYIMACDGDSFYLIDQHAAHERVFYEKLVGEYLASDKAIQSILMPIIVETDPALSSTEDDWIPILRDMGFDIEPFGPGTYRINGIPTYMEIGEAEDFVRYFLDNIETEGDIKNITVIDKLITRSCKSAVKANDALAPEEQIALMKELAACGNPFSCPHGRPTFIRLTRYEIERSFKRIQ